jgi:3,4-dihydroxy 2-butanone 4-phosphate synthase / GTP cyclohydrolase II
MNLDSIQPALIALRQGQPIVVVDDADRENEGDLILPAEAATPERIAFLVRYTSGILCAPMLTERLQQLQLPLMVQDNHESHRTAFTVSVDFRHGTTTGVSASDRAATLTALANPNSVAVDFVRPGHIFPLRYHEGGVLKRRGHTEASIDLMRLAGCQPAAVLSEIVRDDGAMARREDLQAFAREHQLRLISIADIAAHRLRTEHPLEHVSEARLPTQHGDFNVHVFRSNRENTTHVALVRGELFGQRNVLINVHSECLTGDVFGSTRCDCGEQLNTALAAIAAEGRGAVIYLRAQEEQYCSPGDVGASPAAGQILTALGVQSVRLLSNNPTALSELQGYPPEAVERVSLPTRSISDNYNYARTTPLRLEHHLNINRPSS